MRNIKWRLSRLALLALPIIAGCTFSGPPKEEKTEMRKIVVAKDASPWQVLAVEELGHYLKLMAGSEIPVEEIAPNLTAPEKGCVYLGEAAKQVKLISAADTANLDVDGYALRRRDGAAGVFGDKAAGTLYGVYRLLEEMGWKYYGPDCEIIPKTAEIPAGDFREVKNPFFQLRLISPAFGGFYAKNYKDYALTRFGFSVAGPQGGKEASPFNDRKLSVIPSITWGVQDWRHAPCSDDMCHTTATLIPDKEIKTHPEFLARDGKGVPIPKSGHLCLSNQKLADVLKTKVDEWMTNCPTGEFFSVSHADGPGWCECPACLALDPVKAESKGPFTPFLTDRLLHCVNQVADYEGQRHPDKIMLSLSYTASTETAPLKTKPAKNVRMLLCPYTAGGAQCQSHDLACPLNSEFLKHFKDWRKVAPDQLYIFDYPMNYSKLYSPFFSHDAMESKLKFYHANNVRGLWYCGMPRLLGGLFCHIQGKLLWTPDLSDKEIAGLEDEYLAAYYGAAAGDMKKLLGLLRKVNHDPEKPAHQGCHSNAGELSRQDYIPAAYAIMDAAEKAVADNPTFKKRVSLEKLGAVLWLDLDTGFTQNEAERYLRLAEFVRLVRDDQADNGDISLPSFTGQGNEGTVEWLKDKHHIVLDLKKEKLPVEKWYEAKQLDALANCRTLDEAARFAKSSLTAKGGAVRTKDGIEFLLDGFQQSGSTFGPLLYAYECPPARAIGLCGGGKLSSDFELEADERTATCLVLEALDNDKPGKTRIRVDLNGTTIFSGENQASKKDWTELRFPIKRELLGEHNKLEIVDMEEDRPNANWFAFRKASVTPLPRKWQELDAWNFSEKGILAKVVSWCEEGSSASLAIDDKTRTPSSNASLKVSTSKIRQDAPGSAVQVWFPASEGLRKGERYRISLWLMASRRQAPLIVAAIVNEAGYPTPGETACKEVLVEDKKWTPVEIDFVSNADYPAKTRVPNLCLARTEGDQFWIGDVKLERHCK